MIIQPGLSWFTVVTVVRLQDVVRCFKILQFLEGIEPQLLVGG